MKTDEDLKTIEAMELYGGSFVKALAHCALNADMVNLAKIKITWADYWAQYTEMAKNL